MWRSQPRWQNKVRSTTLSLSLLDFEPSWQRCFFWNPSPLR